jgi:hypothetical protein
MLPEDNFLGVSSVLRGDRSDSIPMRSWPSSRGTIAFKSRSINSGDAFARVALAASQLPIKQKIVESSPLISNNYFCTPNSEP